MGVYGYSVKDPNYKLRFFLIIFLGLMGFGWALYWKTGLFLTAEYQDIGPSHEFLSIQKSNKLKQMQMTNLQKKEILRDELDN